MAASLPTARSVALHVLLTDRPGRVERVIEVTLPRPRERSDPAFLKLRGEILELLHFAGSATPAA